MHFQFAYRYLKAKKSANAINIISWVSVVAIALGTAALVIIMSVFNGFEDMVKNLYGTFYTDLKVIPAQGKFYSISPDQLNKIATIPGVKKITRVIEERAILQNEDDQSIVSLKGVEDNYNEVSAVSSSIIKGKFDIGSAEEPRLVLGYGVEMSLGVDAEKAITPITVYFPRQTNSVKINAEDMVREELLPSGTFAIQDEFNNKYAFTNIHFLENYIKLGPGDFSAIEIAMQKNGDDEKIKEQIMQLLGNGYKVQTRYEQNKVLYAAMKLEKWFIYAVLTLIMIIFSFTIISTLSMLVIEKQKDISVLKAMGANNNFIRKIFLSEGFLLSGIGATSGLIVALIICFIQIKFKLVKLSGTSFLIDYYPIKVLPFDLLVIVATVVFITFMAAWWPAQKAGGRMIELRSVD